MSLTTTFKTKGKVYSLALDTDKPDRNYDDENYVEYFVENSDGRIFDITIWKDTKGRITLDGVVEVYLNQGDFEDGQMLDKKYIRLKAQ